MTLQEYKANGKKDIELINLTYNLFRFEQVQRLNLFRA